MTTEKKVRQVIKDLRLKQRDISLKIFGTLEGQGKISNALAGRNNRTLYRIIDYLHEHHGIDKSQFIVVPLEDQIMAEIKEIKKILSVLLENLK